MLKWFSTIKMVDPVHLATQGRLRRWVLLRKNKNNYDKEVVMAYAIIRTQKLKTKQDIAGAGSHAFRLRDTPNARPGVRNYNLVKTDNNDLNQAVSNRIESVGAKTRKDSVRAIEFLLTASPEFFENASKKTIEDWAKKNREWIREQYGSQNLVSAVLHMDETTPHIHAYVVPVTADGRLSAKDMIGGTRHRHRELWTDYAQAMKEFGLVRGESKEYAKHEDIKTYYKATNKFIEKQNPVELDLPPLFKKGREAYRDKVQHSLNQALTSVNAYSTDNERLSKNKNAKAYKEKEQEAEKLTRENRMRRIAHKEDFEDWEIRLERKEQQIELLNSKVEELKKIVIRKEEKEKQLSKELNRYKPSSSLPTPSYQKG